MNLFSHKNKFYTIMPTLYWIFGTLPIKIKNTDASFCVSEALGKPKLCRQVTPVLTDVHDLFDT